MAKERIMVLFDILTKTHDLFLCFVNLGVLVFGTQMLRIEMMDFSLMSM